MCVCVCVCVCVCEGEREREKAVLSGQKNCPEEFLQMLKEAD